MMHQRALLHTQPNVRERDLAVFDQKRSVMSRHEAHITLLSFTEEVKVDVDYGALVVYPWQDGYVVPCAQNTRQ